MENGHLFGSFRLDVRSGTLCENDQPVALPPRAVAVLALLIERRGQVVTKDELLAAAWPDSFVSEDSLTHAVSLIRGALRDDPQSPRFVQTVPRRGYRFLAEVGETRVATPSTPPPAAATAPEPVTDPPVPSRPWPRLMPTAAGLATVAILVLLSLSGRDEPPPRPDAGWRIARIGVQPFAIEPAGDVELRSFADAVASGFGDLIERETRITAVPLGNLGAGPGNGAAVQAMLVAELRREPGGVVFVARVRDPESADVWWLQEWQLPPGEFAPDDLARSMLTRLWPLLDVASAFSTRAGSTSKEATLLLVQAGEMLFGSMQRDFRAAVRAQNVLDRAIAIDPAFARARAALVATLLEGVGWRPLTADEEAALRADADRALQDGPGDPVVQVAKGLLALYDGDLDDAMAALDRAQRLAPGLLWIYLIRPDIELHAGQPQLALASAREGLELDPYMLAMHGRVVDVLLETGDLEQAAVAIERLSALDPGGYWGGRARARLDRRRGNNPAAEHELLLLRERWPDAPWVHRDLADLYAAIGREDDALVSEQTLAAMARGDR